MALADWVGYAAVATVGVAVFTYLRKPSFIPIARADEIRKLNTELRAEILGLRDDITDLKSKNSALTTRVTDLLTECEFWRDRYRMLSGDSTRRPPT